MEKISLKAPAKINLYLEVMGKRDDGYHEIETLMQAVDLYDKINLEKSAKIELTCSTSSLPADRRNLAFRAAEVLQDRFSFPGVKIELEKNIPMGAGLGGGSSDAAFVLRGLCRLFGLHPSFEELLAIAASIGSDVPFFLGSGQALAKGRGEILESISLPLDYKIVIISPSVELSTAEVYGSLKNNLTSKRKAPLFRGKVDFSGLMRLANDFRNDLEEVAVVKYPSLIELKRSLLGSGALYSAMTGSGSSFFGLFSEKARIGKKLTYLEERGIEIFKCKPILLSPYSL